MVNFPSKQNFEYKEQDFFLELNEQWNRSSKFWFILLIIVILVSVPVGLIMSGFFAGQMISSYQPPQVVENPLNPEDLQVIKIDYLPVTENVYSAYAQVINPNPEISAWEIDYSFIYRDASGTELAQKGGEGFVISGESKFLIQPATEISAEVADVELRFDNIRWTKRIPEVDLELVILGEGFGNLGNNFFVEGQVKNLQDFRIREVGLSVVVFDKQNQNPIAINSTVVSHLEPEESRFFRLIWPKNYEVTGNIQIFPEVNPFDAGIMLDQAGKIPQR